MRLYCCDRKSLNCKSVLEEPEILVNETNYKVIIAFLCYIRKKNIGC